MEINIEQHEKVKHVLPVQRGNVSVENVKFINAILYICENDCKWMRLPKEYRKWHPIYKRFRRWVEDGIIDKLFRELCSQGAINSDAVAWLMDSMAVPEYTPGRLRSVKKTENSLSDAPKAD